MPIIVINTTAATLNEEDGTVEFSVPNTAGCAETVLRVPIVAEIEPRPDALYGHTFRWPAQEIAQALADQKP